MALAGGRYLAFLDSDDLWSKEKLSHQLAFMQQNNAPASHTGYAFMSEKEKFWLREKFPSTAKSGWNSI